MTKVSLIVRVEKYKRGKLVETWERSISEENGFPCHLAQMELFNVAHTKIHPPQPLKQHFHD